MFPHHDSHDTDSHDTPELDDALDRSAPPLSAPDGLDAAVATLVADSRAVPRRRRVPRRAAGVIAAGALLAASGTAAAATLGGWTAPWAQEPDGAIEFVLPSGAECEFRIGDLDAGTEGVADGLRTWLDETTLAEITDIAAAIQSERAGRQLMVEEDGTQTEVGYGTEFYDADFEYVMAARNAIGEALSVKANELGLSSGSDGWVEHAGEIQCDATNPEPFRPPWER